MHDCCALPSPVPNSHSNAEATTSCIGQPFAACCCNLVCLLGRFNPWYTPHTAMLRSPFSALADSACCCFCRLLPSVPLPATGCRSHPRHLRSGRHVRHQRSSGHQHRPGGGVQVPHRARRPLLEGHAGLRHQTTSRRPLPSREAQRVRRSHRRGAGFLRAQRCLGWCEGQETPQSYVSGAGENNGALVCQVPAAPLHLGVTRQASRLSSQLQPHTSLPCGHHAACMWADYTAPRGLLAAPW